MQYTRSNLSMIFSHILVEGSVLYELLKTSNIVKESNDHCQFSFFIGKPTSGSYYFAVLDNPEGMGFLYQKMVTDFIIRNRERFNIVQNCILQPGERRQISHAFVCYTGFEKIRLRIIAVAPAFLRTNAFEI